ncbi:hypothetical protein CIB48_g6142 [Xylaria polymorpha]|nr:hypothetical protein CIB48_g6142 [Xylaria polymorpha]
MYRSRRKRVLEWITKVEEERPVAFQDAVRQLEQQLWLQITFNTAINSITANITISTSSDTSTGINTSTESGSNSHSHSDSGSDSDSDRTPIVTFYGDSFCSPSNLVDLRSCSTLLSYADSEPARYIPYGWWYSLCSTLYGEDSVSSLDLNRPAPPLPDHLETQPTDEEIARMADNFVPPGQQRYTRACMVCSIVMTQTRFRNEGCPNCPFLELRGNTDALDSCTSTVFEGLIVVAEPEEIVGREVATTRELRAWRLRYQSVRFYSRRHSQRLDRRWPCVDSKDYHDASQAADAARRQRRSVKRQEAQANATPAVLAAMNNVLIDISDDEDDDDDETSNDHPQHNTTSAPNNGNDDQHNPGSAPTDDQDNVQQQS